MWRELRYRFRQWKHNKAFTAAIVLLLGVCIRVNARVFGFVNAVWLRPLPVRDPGNLFLIEKTRAKQQKR